MRRSALLLVVTSSLLTVGSAATRPHYGGALHIAMRAAPISLDPSELIVADSPSRYNLAQLIFETLVTLDDRGRLQPALANSWQSDPGSQRWQFSLRSGVKFHDGTPLTSDIVAASLRTANPAWKVFPAADVVIVECDSPNPQLPVELSLARNAIARRDGKLSGTGPFAIAEWQPGRKLTLAARDDYWAGRSYIDSIEIEMGRNLRDQMISLDLKRADLIEVAPEQAHRAVVEGRQVESSAPSELMALSFNSDPQSEDDRHWREALALSIDRSALNTVLLQGSAEPAGGLLPNWMTGYAFLIPVDPDLPRARQLRAEARQMSPRTVGYDANDPVARLVAERIALNARDAGLSLQLSSTGTSDARLVRIPLPSLDPRIALAQLAQALALPPPKFAGMSLQDTYTAEMTLLASQRVIPLLHVRSSVALASTVKNWTPSRDGRWHLQDVWLGAGNP